MRTCTEFEWEPDEITHSVAYAISEECVPVLPCAWDVLMVLQLVFVSLNKVWSNSRVTRTLCRMGV